MNDLDQKWLEEKFKRLHEALKAHADLNAEQHRAIVGRIDAVNEDHKRLSSRLWGLAAATLTAIIGAIVALVTGQSPH